MAMRFHHENNEAGGKSMNSTIDILLATCNGASYLPEQLDSLLTQTYHGWRLLVRDDGSSDRTREILENYRFRYPELIMVIPNEGQKLGACGNFGRLLEQSDAPYVMFCDQDDFWLPDKIETTLAAMQELERQHGLTTPLLTHTDLKVVDQRLTVICESLWRFQRTEPQRLTKLNRVLLQNPATGCTMMINRALRDLAVPIPKQAWMHDWWLVLVATAFGRVAAVASPTVLYRQHGQNDCGALRWNFLAEARAFCTRERRQAASAWRDVVIGGLEAQVTAFVDRYEECLPPSGRKMLHAFCSLRSRNFIMRRYLTLRYRFFYSNTPRNLGLMLLR
jgi:glycosyltransferase involved in cell wall biosynthesis